MLTGVRGHNEGSLYRRGNGRWVAAVTMRGGKRETRYARTKAEARERLAELLRRRDSYAGDAGRLPLGLYLERWAADLSDLAPATIRQHRGIIKVHLVPALGRIPLARLTPSDVDRYLAASSLDPQTLRHHRSTLRRALADAVRDGLVARNVAALSRPPRLPARRRTYLDAAQARRLIEGTRGHRFHALWTLAATTGLRSAEALGLAWSDVDLDGATLRVRYQLARHEGEWVRTEPKTARSRRLIPLPPITVEALRAHRDRQDAERGEHPEPIDGLVFTTIRGRPVGGTNVLPELYAELARLGLPRLTFHDLRHSAATILLGAGVPLAVIADILGHATIRVTADLYAHVVPELRRDAAERMQGALEPGSAASSAARSASRGS